MKKKMNRKTIGLVAASLMLVACIGVGSALAYFTTYCEAEGGVKLSLNNSDSEMEEKVINGRKEIILKNTGEVPTYVRLKALTGDDHKGKYSVSEDTKDNWELKADGYYYYKEMLQPGEKTTQIDYIVDLTGTESFNVIIVQESTLVLYDENGTPYCDWSVKADVVQTIVPIEEE